jgi:hypothetical protein
MKRKHLILPLAIAALFATRGALQVLLMPPLESFDSVGHIDYLHYLRDHDKRSILDMPLSSTAISFMELTPSNDNLSRAEIVPDAKGGLLYKDYFQQPDSALAQWNTLYHSLPFYDTNASYVGNGMNWQGKHPPLYYAIVNAFLSPLREASIATGHLAASLLSVLLLGCGVLLLTITGRQLDKRLGSSTSEAPHMRRLGVFLPLAWTLQSMVYIVGARISNDSLAFPLNIAALSLLLIAFADADDERRYFWFMALAGIVTGVAILTKTYALSYVAATPLFAFLLWWRTRRWHTLGGALLMVVLALVVSGATLYYHVMAVGEPEGSRLSLDIRHDGREFSTVSLVISMFVTSVDGYRQFFRMLITRLWVGNWSMFGNYVFAYILLGGVYAAALLGLVRNRAYILSEDRAALRRLLGFSVLLQLLMLAALVNLGLKLYFLTGEPKNVAGYYSYAIYLTELLILWVGFVNLRARWSAIFLGALLFVDMTGLISQMLYYYGAGSIGPLKMIVPQPDAVRTVLTNWARAPWTAIPFACFVALVLSYCGGAIVTIYHVCRGKTATQSADAAQGIDGFRPG